MRLGRGREWAVKKARMEVKERTYCLVRGGFRFLECEVDIAAVNCD